MTRRQFYAWVDQANFEANGASADDPHSWKNAEHDRWWQEARAKRDEQRAR